MIDPEQMRDEHRDRKQSPAPLQPAGSASPVNEATRATDELLAKLRDGEGPGRQWLCIVRSDRRPSSLDELGTAMTQLAEAEGVSTDEVEAAIADALEAEGGSLAQWRADLKQPRKFPPHANRNIAS